MASEKINLTLSGSEIFVWSADDWLKLRQTHRILGNCIGCIAKKPRQDKLSGLPMVLLPQEAKLLIEKGIACLVERPVLKEAPTESLKNKFNEYRNKLFLEEQKCLVESRKLQINSVMDKIVEGKKRKILGLKTGKKRKKQALDDETKKALDSIEIDREALMEDEMSKLPKLEKSDLIVQIHTAFPWSTNATKTDDWNYPSTDKEILEYNIFKNLWERGYYITNGQKFGCDYVAYPGDPIIYHSEALVHCKTRNEEIPVLEFIANSRLGNHVRKTVVFATMSKDNESVEYFTSRWADSSMGDL